MRITPAITAAALLLTLTACSSSEDPATKPAPTTTTASPTATADAEAAAQACSNAVYAAIKDTPTDATDLPKPAECATISDADYLETVLAVIQQQNKDGQDALQKAIEDAASADATP
ncbi:hypothetical protein [Streptomyces sp. NPDC058758]|uniref:hypothetical protein n=1 Tax=Streptomyces sp. NPDC058758 TaxID=3346627 RepID=UPI0036764AFE